MTSETTLRVGRQYLMPDGRIIRVEKMTAMSATVRPVGKKTVSIDGRTFEASGRTFTISPNSDLEEITD